MQLVPQFKPSPILGHQKSDKELSCFFLQMELQKNSKDISVFQNSQFMHVQPISNCFIHFLQSRHPTVLFLILCLL